MGADSYRAEDVQNRPNSVYKVAVSDGLCAVPPNAFPKPSPVWQGVHKDCLAEDKMPQCSLGDDKLFMLFSECMEVYTLILRVLLPEYSKQLYTIIGL